MSMIEHLESRRLLTAVPHLFAHGTPLKVAQLTSTGTVTVAGFNEKVASTYTATIDWADGTTTAGSVIPDPSGKAGFVVQGAHTYAAPGVDRVTVQINGADGSAAKVFSVVRVTDAPITATGQDVSSVVGLPLTSVVATFADPDPASTVGPPSTEIATIIWGDGMPPTPGKITQTSTGNFTVTGTHNYVAPIAAGASSRAFAIKTIIHDRGGAPAVTATSTATIDAPTATTSPSIVGIYSGTVKVSVKLGFISVGKNEPITIEIDSQTLQSITGSITIDGTQVASGTFSGALLSGTPAVQRTNGGIQFSETGTATTVIVSGRMIFDPVTHQPKTFVGNIVANGIPVVGKLNASFNLTKTS